MNKVTQKTMIKGILVGVLYTLLVWFPILLNKSTALAYSTSAVLIVLLNILLIKTDFKRKHLNQLIRGYFLLNSFMVFCLLTLVAIIYAIMSHQLTLSWPTIITILWITLWGAILFWNAIIRVFFSSVQLGIASRIRGTIFGMVPIVNLIMLMKWFILIHRELIFEQTKEEEYVQSTKTECLTKYPILLVHGVFFRDTKSFNYWGRIPYHLEQKGAELFYGKQDSAMSVEESALQIKERILEIIEVTGAEKVNIIAHSKGGLDARYAISCLSLENYVASLTTLSTPHEGCIFAREILNKTPNIMVKIMSRAYNRIANVLGDKQPDFIASVQDLTVDKCVELSKKMENSDLVYYQGYISSIKKGSGARFPLSFVHAIVKKYDGVNDGLVSIQSATSFANTKVIRHSGNRGISHADMIDLHRENIIGFDVRRFYEEIVMNLKQRGY